MLAGRKYVTRRKMVHKAILSIYVCICVHDKESNLDQIMDYRFYFILLLCRFGMYLFIYLIDYEA